MARLPKSRRNYRKEAIQLSKLADLIEIDFVSSTTWKEQVKHNIDALVTLLLNRDIDNKPV